MIYTVTFEPTDADYKILKKRGIALDRDVYPIVSRSGFRSVEEAEDYIASNVQPSFGQSRAAYDIRIGSYPNPDENGWRPITVR
jgi:hypothetical protein